MSIKTLHEVLQPGDVVEAPSDWSWNAELRVERIEWESYEYRLGKRANPFDTRPYRWNRP